MKAERSSRRSSPRSARRGQGDGDDVEAVEEVLAEAALGDALLEVDVGRGEDAGAQGQLALGAERAEAAVLEDAEELGLELGGHLGDLVEEERAGADLLELAADAALGAGERAALVAEDERLDERARQRRAVDGEEGLRAPGAALVEGAGDHLLAAARLAADEHRRARLGDALDQAADAVHRRRGADDGARPPGAIDLLAQAHHLALEQQPLALALDDGQEHLRAELVLGDVVLGAEAHGLAHLGELAHGGDHHRGRLPARGAHAAEDLQAAAVPRVLREADVEEEQIGGGALHRRHRLVEGGGLQRLHVGEGGEHLLEHAPPAALVVDDEDLHATSIPRSLAGGAEAEPPSLPCAAMSEAGISITKSVRPSRRSGSMVQP